MAQRSVVVTGAFGALGKVVSAAFARAGDRVARVDYAPSLSKEEDMKLDLGGVDLTDPQASNGVAERVASEFGGIDVLVNIAGGFTWETLASGEPATWQRMFSMNVLTAATITKAALPHLLASPAGRIVNVGASAAIKAELGMGAYAAAKAGVHRLTEALAVELEGTEVTVNAILPTIIDTPANRADMPDADFATWVQPAAVADAILFLASRQARAVSGVLLPLGRGSPA